MRKLAERSGKATKEIANLINTIQQLTSRAVGAMELGTQEVETGSSLADGAGEALNQILETIRQANQQIMSISEATKEISAGSDEVVKAIDNVAAKAPLNGAFTC